MSASINLVALIRDDHGGAVSLQEMERSVEIMVGVDENADSGKDRPHFVSLKAHQAAELAFHLAQWLPNHELADLIAHMNVLAKRLLHAGGAGGKGGEPT